MKRTPRHQTVSITKARPTVSAYASDAADGAANCAYARSWRSWRWPPPRYPRHASLLGRGRPGRRAQGRTLGLLPGVAKEPIIAWPPKSLPADPQIKQDQARLKSIKKTNPEDLCRPTTSKLKVLFLVYRQLVPKRKWPKAGPTR